MAALLYPRCEDLNKLHCLRMLQLKIQLFWPKDFWREDFKRLFSIFLIYQSPMEHRPQTILFLFHFSIECYVKKKPLTFVALPNPYDSWNEQTWISPSWGCFKQSFSFSSQTVMRTFFKKLSLYDPTSEITIWTNVKLHYLRIIQPPRYIFSDHMVFKRFKKKLSQFIFM